MLEVETDKSLRLCPPLGKDQLEFMSRAQYQFGVRFGTHADPVDAGWRELRPIRLDGDLKTAVVERADQSLIQLQQGLTPCTDYERAGAG
jgi:hypothetical protein